MRRREFLSVLGCVAAAWPLGVRAQQLDMRRIGLLFPLSGNDPEVKVRINAFLHSLKEYGWTEGQTIQIDIRHGDGSADRIQSEAATLIRAAPHLVIASGTQASTALKRATRQIPIVFVNVVDPVASGLVSNLARPGENITGFTNVETTTGGKWFELLNDVAPQVRSVLLLFRSNAPETAVRLPTLEEAAATFGMTIKLANVADRAEIVQAIESFEHGAHSGMIVLPSPVTGVNRHTIISLAAERRIPTIFPYRYFVTDGGLLSYGTDIRDQFRQAANYVDRVLRGAILSELPVQQPTKFELAINLKTAKALGLTIPPSVLARADEVIE